MDFHKFSKEHNHEMIAFETEENSKSLETDKSPQIFTTESFSPNKMSMFSHDYQENPLSKSIKSRTICDNILVCLIFVGILSMFVSLVYVFDLDKNANKFLIIMICSSISIALELFFIVGIDFLDHFGREINMCSLLFAELINISCLIFFAAKAQSAFFTIIFFISQILLNLSLVQTGLICDITFQMKKLCMFLWISLKKTKVLNKNEKIVFV